jgi:hypothetical protein
VESLTCQLIEITTGQFRTICRGRLVVGLGAGVDIFGGDGAATTTA